MKKIAIVFMIILIMTAGFFCQAEGEAAELTWVELLDGEDWQNMSGDSKVFWIMGFKAGVNMTLKNYKIASKKSLLTMNEKELKEFYNTTIKSFEENLTTFGVYRITIEELRKGLENFYKEPENKKIKMVDALYILKMETEGKKPGLIEAQKYYLRAQPIDAVTEASRLLMSYKNIKDAKELFLREGFFAEPKIDKPSKKEDYQLTPLFRYGVYK